MGGSEKAELSPGPPGIMAGDDFRVTVQVIEGSGAYGAGEYVRYIESQGRKRYYEVHVPRGYKDGRKTPVVLVLHGGSGFPGAQRYISGMSQLADREDFIVVYPAGTHPWFTDRMLNWNVGWNHPNRKQNRVDDVAFIAMVIDDLEELFAVDPKRIYVTGISNGAHMAYRLAAKLSDRIAAIAPVAGQIAPGQLDPPPRRPIPIIHFHGRDDVWNPWEGGAPEKSGFTNVKVLPVTEVIAAWAKHNGCPAQPSISKPVGNAVKSTLCPLPRGSGCGAVGIAGRWTHVARGEGNGDRANGQSWNFRVWPSCRHGQPGYLGVTINVGVL